MMWTRACPRGLGLGARAAESRACATRPRSPPCPAGPRAQPRIRGRSEPLRRTQRGTAGRRAGGSPAGPLGWPPRQGGRSAAPLELPHPRRGGRSAAPLELPRRSAAPPGHPPTSSRRAVSPRDAHRCAQLRPARSTRERDRRTRKSASSADWCSRIEGTQARIPRRWRLPWPPPRAASVASFAGSAAGHTPCSRPDAVRCPLRTSSKSRCAMGQQRTVVSQGTGYIRSWASSPISTERKCATPASCLGMLGSVHA